jgi:hypothetical protein
MGADSKKKAILERIGRLEEAITRGRAYLETGAHAHWQGFRPCFYTKVRDGRELPPHKDWVKNVFIPNREKNLRHAYTVSKGWSSRGRPRPRPPTLGQAQPADSTR